MSLFFWVLVTAVHNNWEKAQVMNISVCQRKGWHPCVKKYSEAWDEDEPHHFAETQKLTVWHLNTAKCFPHSPTGKLPKIQAPCEGRQEGPENNHLYNRIQNCHKKSSRDTIHLRANLAFVKQPPAMLTPNLHLYKLAGIASRDMCRLRNIKALAELQEKIPLKIFLVSVQNLAALLCHTASSLLHCISLPLVPPYLTGGRFLQHHAKKTAHRGSRHPPCSVIWG